MADVQSRDPLARSSHAIFLLTPHISTNLSQKFDNCVIGQQRRISQSHKSLKFRIKFFLTKPGKNPTEDKNDLTEVQGTTQKEGSY